MRSYLKSLAVTGAIMFAPLTAHASFLSADPVGVKDGGPGYFNRYSYVLNNPVNAHDPLGLCAVTDGEVTDCEVDFGNLSAEQKTIANDALVAIGEAIQASDNDELKAAWAGTTGISFTQDVRPGDNPGAFGEAFYRSTGRDTSSGTLAIYGPAFSEQGGATIADNVRATIGHELGHGTPRNLGIVQKRNAQDHGFYRDQLTLRSERDAEQYVPFLQQRGVIAPTYQPIDYWTY